jgi:hypothetical protein
MRFGCAAIVYISVEIGCACNVPLERFARSDGSVADSAVADGPVDAAPEMCSQPREICAGQCVNVADSSLHCGRCGHDCGGGVCVAGKCQPVLVADSDDRLDLPAALAVNTTAIFWTERTRVRSCPLPQGCTTEPTLIADGYSALNAIGVTEDAVYFTGCAGCNDHHDMLRCPATGCPDPVSPVASSTSTYEDIVIGQFFAYWRESTDALVGCPHADCAAGLRRLPSSWFGGALGGITLTGGTVYVKPAGPSIGMEMRTCREIDGCAPQTIVTNSFNIVPPFRIRDAKAYWLGDSPTGRVVRVCSLANCAAGTTFAVGASGDAEIAVDDTGVYWMNPSGGTLNTCPLSGCPPEGAVTLVNGRTNPRLLTLGAGFVYWIEGNTIAKIAKR